MMFAFNMWFMDDDNQAFRVQTKADSRQEAVDKARDTILEYADSTGELELLELSEEVLH